MSERQPTSTRRDATSMRILRAVVTQRAPQHLVLVDALMDRPLTPEERELLREVVADEFIESGLGPDDEPNDRGLLLDDLIAWLGHR